ncbi:MAG: NTP transferase domain-containing protein, partial [Calditrichia bacterium]|nr:NTP transferase domain-containing protein [Calditrichia bacterium]
MKQKICALIIARLTSSRLPKKQLRDIAGKPMIYHIIRRLKLVNNIDEVLLATASQKENRELADYVKQFGIETFYYEEENNVVGRIVKAVEFCNADIVVTISGDCPLIDPDFINLAIDGLISSKADYFFVDKSKNKCVHEGIGVRTYQAWKKTEQLSNTWYYKEYAGVALNDNKHLFKGKDIAVKKIFQRNDLRLSVDTPADLEFMDQVFRQFYDEGSVFNLKKVMNLVDKQPWLKLLNSHVHQKTVDEKNKIFIVITHGNQKIGLGHISRSVSLARQLKEAKAAKVIFYIEKSQYAHSLMEKNGFYFKEWNNITELKDLIVSLKGEKEQINSL